jgi:hypothetical protein
MKAVRYTPHPNVTPEAEMDALVRTYKFLLDACAKKNPATGPSGRGDSDGTETKGDSASDRIIPPR